MTYYERLKRKRLGDILVDEEVASKEAVITALHEHQQTKRLLSQILIDGQELTEWDLARVMVDQYQLPLVDLTCYSWHRELIEEFPATLLHRAALIPLDRFGDTVCFACQELPSDETEEELKEQGAKRAFYFAAMAFELRQVLQDHAPVSEADLVAATEGMGNGDGAWKDLFDTANESVVSDLHPDEEGEPVEGEEDKPVDGAATEGEAVTEAREESGSNEDAAAELNLGSLDLVEED